MAPPPEIFYDSPRAELLRFLPSAAIRVLDIGCSGGAFGRTLLAKRPELELWGIEPTAEAAEAARSTFEEVVVGSFPEQAAALDGQRFDVIFFNDVLEHMARPDAALEAAHPLLARGGTLVASIPSVRHFSVWWPLLRHGTWSYEDKGILDRTHLRFFTRSSMLELFAATGWNVSSVVGINRCRDSASGCTSRRIELLSRLSLRRADPFLFAQYVLSAHSID